MDDRIKYIGGSDASGVLGLSRWDSQLKIWAIKTGRVLPEDISKRVNVKLGNKLEETVAEMFTEATGKKVRRVNKTLFHPDYPFIGANIDRDVVGEDAILECKTASAWKAAEWKGEDIPQEYIIQVLHYLAVTGAQKGYIAVLIGNEEFVWKEIVRDEKLINDIIRKEVLFWNEFVATQVMPMEIAKNDGETLYQLFPIADPNQDIILDDSVNQILEHLEAAETEKRLLETDIDKMKNELKALLGDAESGRTETYRITWKNQKTNRLDTEKLKKEREDIYKEFLRTTETRVLRHNKIKQEA